MEETINREDKQGNVVRQSSLRQTGSLKSTLLGRSTSRNSPSFRRQHSSRTPRREGRTSAGSYQWIRGNRLLYWLLLITLWTYLGFYVQSKWAHSDNKEELIGYESKRGISISRFHQNKSPDVISSVDLLPTKNDSTNSRAEDSKNPPILKKMGVSLLRKRKQVSSRRNVASRKSRRSTTGSSSRSNKRSGQAVMVDNQTSEVEEDIPRRNTSFGLIVGPFGNVEDNILGWSAEKRSGTCDRKADFARIVWSRKFVLIFHELSMTGSPLSMMELATEILSCGGTVSVVVLSKKGGLMGELTRRGIKVLKDKAELSYKAAMKADLVIAGSAVCASWIENYLAHFAAGSNQIVWWIMENRREYFDRSKEMLNHVKMLVFLSESQSKQWLAWCEEEHIQLNSQPALIPLSVNDELAFVAGIPCSLNTPSFSVEKMQEKRLLLRETVRREMGLTGTDMLVMSLSSINPGKGQKLLLESALLVIEQVNSLNNSTDKGLRAVGNMSRITITQDHSNSNVDGKQHSRSLFQNVEHYDMVTRFHQTNGSGITSNVSKRKITRLPNPLTGHSYPSVIKNCSTHRIRKLFSSNEEGEQQNLKVLIGSIGSKSNKVLYVKGLLRFLSQHSDLSKLVLWTPATTRVASLYAAADVYVINAQGLGETFGRVTIEAMAFGLPVLGTDAGGTREIVEHNITGLLHPVGHEGTQILAQNLDYLLSNPPARERMGLRGRNKVEKMYLKNHMYERLASVLYKCMRIK